MLDTEAALARALERAGMAPAGAGAAVTAAAAGAFDAGALGRQAALSGTPVPGLVAALRKAVPPYAADTVHQGATSQDIIDTAAMLLARGAVDATGEDLAAGADCCAGLAAVRAERLAVQFGGAARTLASLGTAGPAVARLLAEELALALPVLPWHTDRTRIVEVTAACAVVA